MTGVPITLPAAAADRAFQSVEFWLTVGLLILILLGGAVVLYFTDIWRKRQLADTRESVEALTTFRAMYERAGGIVRGKKFHWPGSSSSRHR